jgi:hypothetical protein
MNVITLTLSRDIVINSTTIGQVGKIIRKHIPAKDFPKIGVLVDFRGDQEPMSVAEVIKQIACVKSDNVILNGNNPGLGQQHPNSIAVAFLAEIVSVKDKGVEFMIIISKSNTTFAPNQIASHMSDAVIGKEFHFTPIYAM